MKPVIVSFPRAGRTWLLTLLGLNICHYRGLPIEQAMVERKKLVDATHDKTDKSLKVHADDLKPYKEEFAGKTVLLLTRDPRDILVSAHLHATKRKGNFKGTLSDYIRDPRYGIEKVVKFYNIWRMNKRVPASYLEIDYEDLLMDTVGTLQTVCAFLKVPYTGTSILQAVRDGHIDKLREKEASGFFAEGIGKPKRPGDPDSYYHRKGGSGGFIKYMTDDDIIYCDAVMAGDE
jgi:hypothetical protein